MKAKVNIAVGASGTTMVSASSHPRGLQTSPFFSKNQRNKQHDNFFRTYGTTKQESSSIIALRYPLASIRSSSKNKIHSQNRMSDSDSNLCFPQRLFQMLNKIDQQFGHLSHIVSWHASGMGFLIHKPESFIKEVMPIFFQAQSKLTSFQRQLNNYGFQRIQERKDVEGLTYYHKHFLRDDPEECQFVELKRCKMTCKKNTEYANKHSNYIHNKAEHQVKKEERLSLLLQMIPKLRAQSTANGYNAPLLKNAINAFGVSSAGTSATAPLTTALSLFALFNEGDTVLDEAADAIYDKAQEQIQEHGSTTKAASTPLTSTYPASFWDPEIESLDTREGI